MAVLFVSLAAAAADSANAKKPPDRGDADAGRDLAEQACTGCHVVSIDQPKDICWPDLNLSPHQCTNV